MPRRRAILAGAVLLLVVVNLAQLAAGEPGVVVARDGSTYEGDVTETEEEVTITRHGVQTVLPRKDVVSIRYNANYETEFRDRLAKLEANDVKGRIALAREAFDERRYDLARDALHDALRVDPNSREATDMLEIVERQIRLERAAPPRPADRAATRPAPQTRGGPLHGERRLLTQDDINVIRQKELKRNDSGVRISIPLEVRRRFAEQQNMTYADFNRLPPVEQAIRVIDEGDQEMRRQVRVQSDPSALVDFKRSVQPIVLGGCATSACHGGPAGGDFMLFSPADSDAVAYTNFYILTQYTGRAQGTIPPGGVFGSSMRKMIERGRGDMSLLASYGLPVNVAEFDHPEVGGKSIQPLFRNKQDQRYQQIVNWMDNSLLRIEPNYEINYALPRASTQPATQPER
jgi:hypothetical protein